MPKYSLLAGDTNQFSNFFLAQDKGVMLIISNMFNILFSALPVEIGNIVAAFEANH